jgi:hypothetical protein
MTQGSQQNSFSFAYADWNIRASTCKDLASLMCAIQVLMGKILQKASGQGKETERGKLTQTHMTRKYLASPKDKVTISSTLQIFVRIIKGKQRSVYLLQCLLMYIKYNKSFLYLTKKINYI